MSIIVYLEQHENVQIYLGSIRRSRRTRTNIVVCHAARAGVATALSDRRGWRYTSRLI
jgi:hypothetical protein